MANDWMTDDDEDQGSQVAAMDDQPIAPACGYA
jgi:hypothetical protein